MNTRRRLLLALGAGALAGPTALIAQAQPKMVRIGFPSLVNARSVPWIAAFDRRLMELGYIEGKNIAIEFQNAEGKFERLSEITAEMVRHNVDLLLAGGAEAVARAARQATSTIPIVVVAVDYDPVAAGYAASLARPGGNVTGVFSNQLELAVKRLELLKQALPKISRVAVLWDEISVTQLKPTEAAAKGLGLQVQALEMRNYPYDYASAFGAATRERAQAIVPLMSPLMFRTEEQIIRMAKENSLPTMAGLPNFAESGGLMSYGADLPSMYRRAAELADQILKGARAADMPIEQPTHFQLVINMKTAKSLGIKIPDIILVRADKVIE
jgi:putative tryptophan/tyrosine transport system substrate-binding protein